MQVNVEQTAEGIAIRDLENRINNPSAFLAGVGGILVASSQKAFRDQAFGGIPWPERYPDQTGAKLNIAGALADAAAGRPAPKPNRFNDRPAAMDTGALKNSISFRVEGDSVFCGTTNPHAQITQEGGTTVRAITASMRSVIAGWLKKATRAKNRVGASLKAFDKHEALGRLRFVFFKRNGSYLVPEKKTEVNARPFVGLTDEARGKIEKFGAKWFAGKAGE